MSNLHFYDLHTSSNKMIYFYPMFISGHSHYLQLKVLLQYFPYISFGQLVCCALIKDGGKTMKELIFP